MCGIIYVHDKRREDVSKSIIKRYYKQKSRGSDGFGFISFDLKTLKIGKIGRSQNEGEIVELLKNNPASAYLFHHRFPTSTPNIKEATHPIIVKNPRLDNKYYVVHNGIIENDEELKKDHEKLGYKYTTEIKKTTLFETKRGKYEETEFMFNDSEALAIDIAEMLDGKKDRLSSKGSIAFVALQVRDKKVRKLFYGRNSRNPLTLEQSGSLFAIKSEEGKSIEDETLFCYDFETEKITDSPLVFPNTINKWDWQRPNEYDNYNNPYANYSDYEVEDDKRYKEAFMKKVHDLEDELSGVIDPLWFYDPATLFEFGNDLEEILNDIDNQIMVVESFMEEDPTLTQPALEIKRYLTDLKHSCKKYNEELSEQERQMLSMNSEDYPQHKGTIPF